MKKLLVIGAAVVMLLLSSCGAKECSLCGEKKAGKTLEYQGEKAFFCNECAEGIEAIINLAEAAEAWG